MKIEDVRMFLFMNGKSMIGFVSEKSYGDGRVFRLEKPLWFGVYKAHDCSRSFTFQYVVPATRSEQFIDLDMNNPGLGILKGPYKPAKQVAMAYMEKVLSGAFDEAISVLYTECGPVCEEEGKTIAQIIQLVRKDME